MDLGLILPTIILSLVVAGLVVEYIIEAWKSRR